MFVGVTVSRDAYFTKRCQGMIVMFTEQCCQIDACLLNSVERWLFAKQCQGMLVMFTEKQSQGMLISEECQGIHVIFNKFYCQEILCCQKILVL